MRFARVARSLAAVSALALLLPALAFAQGAMTNGVNHTGTISSPGEVDTWTFTATNGGTFIASVAEVVRTPDTGFVPWVRVYNSIGTQLASDLGGLVGQGVVVNAPAGVYTITVASNAPAAVGDYRLTVAHGRDPFTTSAGDQGGALVNGANQEGRIELGDLDIWTFTRQPGEGFVVSLTEDSASDDAGFVPWVRVYDPNGLQLTNDYGARTAQVYAGTSLSPLTVAGTYTVIAGTLTASGNAGRDGVADYLLRLAALPGDFDIPPGDHGGSMTSGANHTGRIELGDLDIWTFERQQTDGFLLSLNETTPTGADEPSFVPWIRVYDPSGAPVGNDYGARSAFLAAGSTSLSPLPLSGRYTVVVGSLTASGNAGRDGVSNYTLRLVEVPGDFTVPTGDDGGAMSNGVVQTARIDLGDLDPWTFHACVGQQLTVTAQEVAGPDLGLVPWVRLYDRTGDLVAHNFGNGTVPVVYTPGLSGRYTVVVGTLMASGNSGRDGIGDYTLQVAGACPLPVSLADAYATPFNTALTVAAPGVLANDTGGTSVAIDSTVPAGALTLNANGGFTFTPQPGFVGPVQFTYHALNAAGAGNIVGVTITVGAAPGPTAAADNYTATANTALVVVAPGVLSNDTSPGGSAMTATLVSPTSNGGINLSSSGGFTYTPNTGFSGIDAFTYRVSNANGQGNVATVTITVQAAPTSVQAPTNLFAHAIIGDMVTLRWSAPATGPAPTSYAVEGGVNSGQVMASIPTGSTVPLFTFKAPSGAFYLRLKAVAAGQTSAASNEIRVFVNQPVAPSAPSHLLGLVNGSAVALSWRPTFGGGAASSYILDVTGTVNASLPVGLADSFTFNGVPGGGYTFRVRAVNAFGASGASNSVPLAFPGPCTGAPQTPADFLVYRVGNTVHLLWNPAAAGPAQTAFVLNVTGAFNLSLPLPTRGISSPVPPGSYTFTVAAANACGTSAATAAQTVVIP